MWRDILPGGRVSASDINNLADWGEQTVTGNVGVTRSAAGLHISANDDARILIRITGAADEGAYPWEEVYRDAVLGTIEVVGDGREGTTDDVPAYELSGYASVATGTVVEATLDDSGEFLTFEVPGSAITATFIVGTVDGSPLYSGIHSFAFDELDGFVITNPTTGVARVDIAPASATQAGVVDLQHGQQLGLNSKYLRNSGGGTSIYLGVDSIVSLRVDTIGTGGMRIGSGRFPGELSYIDGTGGAGSASPYPIGIYFDHTERRLIVASTLSGGGLAEQTNDFNATFYAPFFGIVSSGGGGSTTYTPGVSVTEAGVTYTGGIRTSGTLAVPGSAITGTIDGGTW